MVRSWLREGAFFAAALAASAALHLRSRFIADPDSFYHLAHAGIYRSRGPLLGEFPWIPWSVIKVHGADIWYGFHLALVPFTLIEDKTVAIKAAGIALTVCLLVTVRFAACRLELASPYLWPFVVLLASPNALFHFTMGRPHVLTAALGVLLMTGLLQGPVWLVFLASLGMAFNHLGVVWMAGAIILAVLGTRAALERAVDTPMAVASIAGLLAGWLARPHPLGAGAVAYVQIVRFSIEKLSGVPLLVGTELLPATASFVLVNLMPLLALWVLGLLTFAVIWRRGALRGLPPATRALLLSSMLLAAFFFLQIPIVARRAASYWTLFEVLFLATLFTILVQSRAGGEPPLLGFRARRAVKTAGLVLFLGMAAQAIHRTQWTLSQSHDPEESRAAAEWIGAHSAPGEIVYNVHWDAFPGLFLWNQANRYTRGMDPIFEYAYDPSLYYRSFYLHVGKGTAFTCGAPTCTRETLEDTYTALRREFQASWLFVEKDRSPSLYSYANSDPRFVLSWENDRQAVFDLRGRVDP